MNGKDFEIQWQRRQQALQDAPSHVPSDATIQSMAQRAIEQVAENEIYEPLHRSFSWVPFAAVAGLLLGISIIGLKWYDNRSQLPATQEVSIDGQTIQFLCNTGCSANDIVQSVHSIMTN